jgi:hypothetical protein
MLLSRNVISAGGAVSDLICKHCGQAVPVPPGFMLVPVASAAQADDPAVLSFEQQQEALYAILASYQDVD